MREMEARGWSNDLHTWVYGAYFEHCTCAVCFSEDDKPEYHEGKIVYETMTDWSFPHRTMVADVVRESVGEFTGYIKDQKRVYEGDIIKYHFGEMYGVIRFGKYQSCFDPQKTEHCGFYVDWGENKNLRKDLGYWLSMLEEIEILGNEYENPELIQGGANHEETE